jgi:hypothetical protein
MAIFLKMMDFLDENDGNEQTAGTQPHIRQKL